MNIRKTILLCMIALCVNAYGKVKKFNYEWQFQRLSSISQKTTIKNQGSDWSSQYNVEYTTSATTDLSVPQDTLKAEFSNLNASKWESVRLPHTPVIEELTVLHQWQGVCYYRKKFQIAANELNQNHWIEFKGAMQLADVWVNGEHQIQHAGGYTPFVVDLTGKLKAENEILVRLDNRNNPLIPPGKPLNTLDFCYYGGLYRGVTLITKPAVHITHPILADKKAGGGIFVTYPNVTKQQATVAINTDLANTSSTSGDVTVSHTLFELKDNKRGRKVAFSKYIVSIQPQTSTTLKQNIKVVKPALWSPEFPNRYLLLTQVLQNNKIVDSEETKIGIRHLEITREKGFVLNGEPLRLVGSNRHMEYPYIGNALSDNAQYRDIYQIKMNGFNIVRLGHYPQDPSVLDACDELGLLVIEPIPGWQFFNKNPLFTELTYRDIRDLIRRDRNHPSIVMWETTLNEAWPPKEWKDGAVKVAHEEYPGDQFFSAGDLYGYDGFSISYNDWEEGFNRPNTSKNPGFIREYYDYEFGGHYSTSRVRRGDGEKALLQNAWNAQWSHNRYRAYYPWTIGDAVWSMYDYNRGCCDNICYSGVADIFRLPKYSLDFFRNQVPAGTNLPTGKMPYSVSVANSWTKRSPEQDTVMVYSNTEEVEIKVNGKTIKRQKADKGADTEYVAQADGGNCRNLTYPPFTFKGITWESGVLEVVGYQCGKRVASQIVKTPEAPSDLNIEYFESGRKAAKNDMLIVYVSLLDKNGTVIPNNDKRVKLEVDGGTICGPAERLFEAGVASFVVQTKNAGQLHLRAYSDNKSAKKAIDLK